MRTYDIDWEKALSVIETNNLKVYEEDGALFEEANSYFVKRNIVNNLYLDMILQNDFKESFTLDEGKFLNNLVEETDELLASFSSMLLVIVFFCIKL